MINSISQGFEKFIAAMNRGNDITEAFLKRVCQQFLGLVQHSDGWGLNTNNLDVAKGIGGQRSFF